MGSDTRIPASALPSDPPPNNSDYGSHQEFYLGNVSSTDRATRRLQRLTTNGQQRPDAAWVQRNDQRGVCIPPYFVFQFRSDGHPAPPATTP